MQRAAAFFDVDEVRHPGVPPSLRPTIFPYTQKA